MKESRNMQMTRKGFIGGAAALAKADEIAASAARMAAEQAYEEERALLED